MIASHSLDRPRRAPRLACALLATLVISGPAGAQITKKVEPKSSYYRIVVDLTYRNEPLNFDVTVACNGRETTYVDGDRSFLSGLTPAVFGKRMPDGAAVVMVSPELCQGEVERGMIQKEFFPLLIHFDDADNPWTGYGYMTDAAYERRASPMRLGTAKVTVSDAESFRKWYSAHAQENLVKPEMASHIVGQPFAGIPWKPGDRYFPNDCAFASKIGIPEGIRDRFVRTGTKDTPFWASTSALATYKEIFFWKRGQMEFPSLATKARQALERLPGPNFGIARRGSETINRTSRIYSDVYPVKRGADVNVVETIPLATDEIRTRDFRYGDDLLGLAYCTNSSGRLGAPVSRLRISPLNSVNGTDVDDPEGLTRTSVFHNTEFILSAHSIGFFDSFGGL